MDNRTRIFSGVAYVISIYHGILGLLGTFVSADIATRIIQMTYGVSLDFGDQTLYLVKFISAYMLAFAVAMYWLAKKPQEFRHLIWVPVVLFGVRIFDRLFFFDMLSDGFGMTIQRDLITVAVIACLLGLLVYYRPRA